MTEEQEENQQADAQKTARFGRPSRLLGLLVLAASLTGGWFWLDYQQFLQRPLNIPKGGLVYTLKPGTTLRALAEDLAAKNVLRNPWYLRALGRLEPHAQQIKAGEYLLPEGIKPRALLALFIQGRVTQHSLTLVEGWTFAQVMAAVRRDKVLEHTLDGLDAASVMERLGHAGEHPEGRFYPDTYRFPRGATDVQFLARAYRVMEKVLEEEWAERAPDLPLKNPYEALILASIVEKETGRPEERAEIAGVFVRRLRKGMKLQTDPTVIYGMGARYDGNIRRKDLREDTPYNTYVHTGLPPTPIAMPGRAAIHAVLHPAGGDALFFVARGDGSHQFSATLKAHTRAVRKYQLKK